MEEPVTTDGLAPLTDPCDTPPIIESDLAESVVIGTEEPQEPHISDHPTMPLIPPKREFHFNWWSIITLALLFLLAVEHVSPLMVTLVSTYLHPTATVTLFPTQQALNQTYSFLAVTGTADPVQKQVSSRLLTFTTPTKTETITTTGTAQTPPIQAQGAVTFYNETPYSQTIDAGTVITGSDGVQIVTDETVTIAAGSGATNGSATITAHTIQAGSAANIAPLDINGLCCVAGILVKNTSGFTGGEDPKSYPTLSQSDVDAATKQIAGTLDPLAKVAITSQMKTTEQILTPLNCTYQTIATPKVGEKATTAQVNVSETCNGQVYDDEVLQTLTRSQFLRDVATQAGADFIPTGTVAVALKKAMLLDKSHNAYQLDVTARGRVIFHLSKARLSTLTRQIAGKRIDQAQKHLLALHGVQGVSIQPAGTTDTSLPTDPSHIVIQVMTGS